MSKLPSELHDQHPRDESDVHDSKAQEEVNEYFKPYVRIDPPWDVYEIVKTVLCAVFVLPFRLIFLVTAGSILWVISHAAMFGVKDKIEFLNLPLSYWRKLLLSSLFPVVRSILFVSFGVYHIQTEKVTCSSIQQYKMAHQNVCNSFHDDKLHRESCILGRQCQSARDRTSQLGDDETVQSRNAYVIVSNHLGYIDIIVLLAKYRGSFVAQESIEDVPVVGIIATAMQCMFVRDGSSLTSQLVDRVRKTDACHADVSQPCPGCPSCFNKLIIFPEGTTCNGTSMVSFRSGVFNASLPVLPVCIRFPHKHFNLSWESIRFREHLFRTMTQFKNNVTLTELPIYVPDVAEQQCSKLYSFNVQHLMARVLDQTVCPLNRKQKFLYHDFLRGKLDRSNLFDKARAVAQEDASIQYFLSRAERYSDMSCNAV